MDKKDYKELVDFIGNKFDKVDQRLDNFVDEFETVHKGIAGLNFKFDDLKKDFRQLQSGVDAYAHQANTYFMEMVALGSKLDRHERWINQIAEKVGVKLNS